MALRVPKAELPAGLKDDMIKQLGAVPEPVEVTYNHPEVAMSSQEFSARAATWDAADAKPPLSEVATEALNPGAGFFKHCVRCRVGNPEKRRQPERRSVYDSDSFFIQKRIGEIFVASDFLPGPAFGTNHSPDRWIDVKRAFRHRAFDT